MKEKNRLLELIKERALIRGEIKLSSGKTSNYYLDCRRITLDPEGAYLVAEIILGMLDEEEIDAIGGLTLGADPICGSLAAASYLSNKLIPAFIVRKELKKHGTMKSIEGNLEAGFRVAIVDDVSTSGGSLLKAIDVVEGFGCRVKRVIVVVDRGEGAREALARHGHRLEAIYSREDLGI